jgi:thiol:disulfide interchange protein DsbG
MVADPNCPFCHALWRDLRPMIMSQEISLRVIMIAGLVNSEADAISILSRQDPGQAWFAGEGSERTMPVAAPPQKDSEAYKNGYRYLERNMVFIEKMGVVGTPHLFYFDAEGALYESAGIPENRSAFFGSLTE